MLHHHLATENRLSLAMLEEIIINKEIKNILKNISLKWLNKISTPIKEELNKVDDFSNLPNQWRTLLITLGAQHTAEMRQYGALHPEVASSKELLSSLSQVKKFIADLENTLLNLEAMKTIDEVALVIKTLIEFGYTYYEAPKEIHGVDFEKIDLSIGSTKEELDIRLFRYELGEPEQFALSFGIEKEDKNLALASLQEGAVAGKAVFKSVSMKQRLALIRHVYDQNPSVKNIERMNYYHIPLPVEEREPIKVDIRKWKTFLKISY